MGSIGDLKERLRKAHRGQQTDTSFRAHVRTVEDMAINKDSMHMSMMFGLYGAFLRTMLSAKGNENATISITGKDAAKRAAEMQKLAEESSWFKQAKERKAAFYAAIAEGRLPPGFLSLKYISPATNREITRYFDSMMSSENFGSPIAFGNMLDSDISEFFTHRETAMEKFGARVEKLGDEVVSFLKQGRDWFTKLAEPKGQLGEEDMRCCCKDALHCELLVGEELAKSWNVLKWGKPVCPSDLGYHHYRRFGLTEKPKACFATR
eukprot:SRR837773.5333.p1 GENE.SRR837773.5333~~SRR837773.5333.p1  ORF type:complete len:272 (-),score=92.57 SRR837773.5333:31-825(-)